LSELDGNTVLRPGNTRIFTETQVRSTSRSTDASQSVRMQRAKAMTGNDGGGSTRLSGRCRSGGACPDDSDRRARR
jgi:hypothetical protein